MTETCDRAPVERTVSLPDSAGHWELKYGEHRSMWDVYMRENWPRKGDVSPFATNENQTDPCAWLGDDNAVWRKISGHYQGRLMTNSELSGAHNDAEQECDASRHRVE